MRFEVTILGCGAALPTNRYHPTAQVLNIHEKWFLVDCGEGTQMHFRSTRLSLQKINRIFISHLHGDHFYGLPGFLSTLHLLGRTKEMHIYGPANLEPLLTHLFALSDARLKFSLIHHPVDPKGGEVVYEDHTLSVISIPAKHSVAGTGYLFKEKVKPLNLIKEQLDRYRIPIVALQDIKKGEDYTNEKNITIPNKVLTQPPKPVYSYAFCSDSVPNEKTLKAIRGVDLLYHEATFMEDMASRARATLHSTAKQAGEMAKKAGVGRLLLGHFSARYKNMEPLLAEARAVFPHSILSEEGVTYKVNR